MTEIEFTPKDLKQFEIKKDFVFGGSKEILLHKDNEEDFVVNNEPPRVNARYMRKDTEVLNNQR